MKLLENYNRTTFSKGLPKLIVILFFLAILTSCNKDDDAAPIQAALSSISPESGPKNTSVSINGSNFGTNTANIKVYFNDVEAVVESVTDTEIKATVPRLAMTGFVKVIVDGKELLGPEFIYEFSEAHVTTLAGDKEGSGYADGQGTAAKFGAFDGIAIDTDGNVFTASHSNIAIRKITPNGLVSTLFKSESGYLDGNLSEAKASWPQDIVIDATGNKYFIDANNYKIRKISPEDIVSTLAGSTFGYADGQGIDAKFAIMYGITVDALGNVYVVEQNTISNTSRIRKITPEGVVSTLAGGEIGYADGQGTDAKFDLPYGLAIDSSGNIIVVDASNNKIRKVSPTGLVTTIAGSTEGYEDGNGEAAKFNFPYGVTVDKLDNIYVADYSNMRIRKITPDGTVSTLAGSGTYGFNDGEGLDVTITFPRDITVDDDFNLYFTQNRVVRKITQE